MFEKTPSLGELSTNKIEFPQQAEEMIDDFKELLSSLVAKYDFVKRSDDLLKIDKDELSSDLLYAQVKINNIREKNNNSDFKKYFYEFSSVLSGAIHDIRNAINFLLNQIEDDEELSMSLFNRFFSYHKRYNSRKTVAEFIGQSIYVPFETIEEDFLQMFKESFADFNYNINYSDGFIPQNEINYNSSAILLLFNELATNLQKYGQDENINLEFLPDHWQLNIVNKVKKDIDKRTFSSNTGMTVLNRSVKILGGEILENGVNNNIYKFKANLSLPLDE